MASAPWTQGADIDQRKRDGTDETEALAEARAEQTDRRDRPGARASERGRRAPLSSATMDPLSQSLRTMHLAIRTSNQLEAYGPMGTRMRAEDDFFMLFTVLEGQLWFDLGGHDAKARSLRMEPGDLGLSLGRRTYVVRDSPNAALVGPRERPSRPTTSGIVRHGHRGRRRTVIRSVFFDLHAGAADPLFAALAPVLCVHKRDDSRAGQLLQRFVSLFEELSAEQPGSYALTERLTEALLIELVRAHVAGEDVLPVAAQGALADPAITAALTLIHRDPGAPWTLETLAGQVSLSRTTFAVRFAARVGESPFRYLTARRMELGQHLLTATDLPLPAIAERVGYADGAAFHRAFTRWAGVRPGEVRTARHDARTQAQRLRT